MENEGTLDAKPEDIVYDWWSSLTRAQEPGQPSNRGELAELKRCKTLEEVFFSPAFHRLFHRLAHTGWNRRSAVAAVAGVLAHVEKEPDTQRHFSKHLAAPRKSADAPLVRELRFRRLISNKEHQELYPALLRILGLTSNTAPVKDLANGVYWWNDRIRSDWTFEYYDALLNRD